MAAYKSVKASGHPFESSGQAGNCVLNKVSNVGYGFIPTINIFKVIEH